MKYISLLFLTVSLFGSWADDRLAEMILDEKIGQLFVVPGCPLRGYEHRQDLKNLIENYHIGGIILKQSETIEQQLDFMAALKSKTPLLFVGDAEWGIGMRIKEAPVHPKNRELGQVDLKTLEEFGSAVGKECKESGLHINLAPVVDVCTNPNSGLGTRSFGDNPEDVALRGRSVIEAMQREGIFATAKHFPGHGAATTDSHLDLPSIDHLELLPFQEAIKAGVHCIMTAHLFYDNEIVTFSPRLVHDLLRNQLEFDGLIITDALNMNALALYYSPGLIALNALIAGHDLLLYGDHKAPNVDQILQVDVPEAILAIHKAIKTGHLSPADLDNHVLRILKAKERFIYVRRAVG
jgi:beta-glucosidase-like glycosyl hydrolase